AARHRERDRGGVSAVLANDHHAERSGPPPLGLDPRRQEPIAEVGDRRRLRLARVDAERGERGRTDRAPALLVEERPAQGASDPRAPCCPRDEDAAIAHREPVSLTALTERL